MLALVAAQLTLAVGLRQRALWQVAIAGYVVGAPIAHVLGVLVHEYAHNLVFRSGGANKALSIVANIGLGAPGAIAFRHEHLLHHRFLGDGAEPDGGDTQAPLSREVAWSGQSVWRRLACFRFGRFFFGRRSTNRTPMDGWLVANHAVCLLALAALLAVGGLRCISYLLLSLLFAFGPHPLGGRKLAEHLTLRRGQPTVSYYGPANRISFDVGYHVEHHDFPHVPWRRLRRLRDGARDDYVGLASVTSWSRLLVAHLAEPGRHAGQYVGFTDDYVEEDGRIDDDLDAPAPRRRTLATRGDLQHLFGDADLLERVAEAGQLARRSVLDTLDRTRVQFQLRAEDEWDHVTERSRLVAVDHRDLDEGKASESAATIDVEDYAVLFELARLRASRREGAPARRLRTYDVLVLYEAQELAPLELALLGRSLEPGGTLIVAGDADQHTDETSGFLGWEDTMAELGHPDHDTVRFEIGYRCPPEVVALAHAVIGNRPAGDLTQRTTCHAYADEAELFSWLTRDLSHLLTQDRRAAVAALCRSPRAARRTMRALHDAEVPARLVFDGRFFARGAVPVTTVDEVKGLEFAFVIIPDAGNADYPDDAAARRAMYVAVTRARHQVVLACVGQPSAVLAGALVPSPRGPR